MGMEANQFDLLVDVDNDDPSLVIAAKGSRVAQACRHGAQSKPLTKPLPPAQAGAFALSENGNKQEDIPQFEVEKNKEGEQKEEDEKEPEDREITSEEYEEVLEDKRKALLALKAEERKVEIDKVFQSIQKLFMKKDSDEVFIKLGSEKDKRIENVDRDEPAKKSLSINEFLKPDEGERYPGRDRGRAGGDRGGYKGDYTL